MDRGDALANGDLLRKLFHFHEEPLEVIGR
jgi:hypothetical protein